MSYSRYVGSTRVAMRMGSTLKFLLGDHPSCLGTGLGSTSVTTDSSGIFGSAILYYPWGGRRWSSGSIPTNYQYTDQRIESNLGLYFYNARWYDSYLNRWIQPDSIIPSETGNNSQLIVDYHETQFLEQLNQENHKHIDDPQSQSMTVPINPQAFDRYAYGNNNPVRYNDPTGHRNCEEDGINCFDNQIETLWDNSWNESKCSFIDSCVGQYVKYYTLSGGTAIPNPITGTAIGWHFTISLDQYKKVFFGLGLDAGKNVLGWSASLVEGRFAKDQLPDNTLDEEQFLEKFLTGNSAQGYIVPLLYIGANWSTSTNQISFEEGAGSPQAGVSWTYTWKLSK